MDNFVPIQIITIDVTGKSGNTHTFTRTNYRGFPVNEKSHIYLLTEVRDDGKEIIVDCGEADNYLEFLNQEENFNKVKEHFYHLNNKFLYVIEESSKTKREEIVLDIKGVQV
jgi:hypothetical protein